jgi:predicted PhzF superfamily epimerase YddE/YHI9
MFMHSLPFMLVDAFAARPFTGNPAAVVWLDDELHDAVRQSLAMEFNQAETAFVRSLPDGRFELRWFTPAREVPLCGHATLASAAALRVWGKSSGADPIRFLTLHGGELLCRFDGDEVVMDFPATPPQSTALPPDAAEVLRIAGPVECVGTTTMNLTLRVPSAEQVGAAAPDMARLAGWHAVGVTITAPGDSPGVDFVSRFFAPNCGIPEDPVTGSAHCALACYWAGQLGKTDFIARQLSPRGGELGVRLLGDRVELRGPAVVVMRGNIEL